MARSSDREVGDAALLKLGTAVGAVKQLILTTVSRET